MLLRQAALYLFYFSCQCFITKSGQRGVVNLYQDHHANKLKFVLPGDETTKSEWVGNNSHYSPSLDLVRTTYTSPSLDLVRTT